MARYIDADKLNLDAEVEMADDWKTAHEIANIVKYAPTEGVAPVVHAKWILNSFPGSGEYVCSNCRRLEYFPSSVAKDEYKYCPYCGAKMEGEE